MALPLDKEKFLQNFKDEAKKDSPWMDLIKTTLATSSMQSMNFFPKAQVSEVPPAELNDGDVFVNPNGEKYVAINKELVKISPAVKKMHPMDKYEDALSIKEKNFSMDIDKEMYKKTKDSLDAMSYAIHSTKAYTNAVIQSQAADLDWKEAMPELLDLWKKHGIDASVLGKVHDSVVVGVDMVAGYDYEKGTFSENLKVWQLHEVYGISGISPMEDGEDGPIILRCDIQVVNDATNESYKWLFISEKQMSEGLKQEVYEKYLKS